MSIRPFSPDDTDALISIWERANALAHPFITAEFVADLKRQIGSVHLAVAETWVSEEGGAPAGFIALISDEIGGLFVDPDKHGHGHGSKLVDVAVQRKGPLRVEVFKDNHIGRRFYRRCGFSLDCTYLHEPTGLAMLCLTLPQQRVTAIS